MTITIYPNSMLRPNRIDEDFAIESLSSERDYVLYSKEENKLYLRGKSLEDEILFYRGWILTELEYSNLESLVKSNGGSLYNDSTNYSNAQFGNRWIKSFEIFTPKTIVLPYASSAEEFVKASETLNSDSFILKGVSKSLKHDWENSMFADNATRIPLILENFRNQVTIEEEPELLLREFENWLPGEIRSWWFNSESAGYDYHPQSPEFEYDKSSLEGFLSSLQDSVKSLSNALTIDVVRDVNGVWRIVEVGSASVSEAREDFNQYFKF